MVSSSFVAAVAHVWIAATQMEQDHQMELPDVARVHHTHHHRYHHHPSSHPTREMKQSKNENEFGIQAVDELGQHVSVQQISKNAEVAVVALLEVDAIQQLVSSVA